MRTTVNQSSCFIDGEDRHPNKARNRCQSTGLTIGRGIERLKVTRESDDPKNVNFDFFSSFYLFSFVSFGGSWFFINWKLNISSHIYRKDFLLTISYLLIHPWSFSKTRNILWFFFLYFISFERLKIMYHFQFLFSLPDPFVLV